MANERKEPQQKKGTKALEKLSPEEEKIIHGNEFQFALKELLAAYRPVLEQELQRAKDAEKLKEEAARTIPNCDDEFELASRIFEKFFSEEVAMSLLPEEAKKLLGPIERWRWCFLHLRCCLIFGWLICRRPQTFRGYAYYLYRYWICVRRVLGNAPVGRALTDQERQDFTTLVKIFAGAYKPYLADQLAAVEFSDQLPDEIFDGEIDCFEGVEDMADVFERALTAEAVSALLGKEAFEKYRQEPYFWLCRCWCLCSIRFGCCLARANNLIGVLRCLLFYWHCIQECVRPLVCEIIEPGMNSCTEEQYFPGPNVLGIEIVGTATGMFCDHYTLEWKAAGAPDTAYTSAGIVYAGTPGPGICGKVNTTLGYLSTAVVAVPDNVTVRLNVVGTAGVRRCLVDFEIFRMRVWITGIEGVTVESPPGVLGPTAQLKTGSETRSFGTAIRINGRAWVGKCAGREIKRYTLSYQSGFVSDPELGPWVQFWQVDYQTALQRKEIQESEFALTSRWRFEPVCLPAPFDAICVPKDWLTATRWWSGRRYPDVAVPPQSFPVDPEVPAVVWSSQQLPLSNCQSGKFTLRLDVEDTLGNHYYDIQQVWFDNKKIHGKISQVAGVPPCDSINLSQFAAAGADCTQPWLADLLGVAYDEYIEEGNPAVPSDNFGGYRLWIKKDGAPDPGAPLTIPGPGAPPAWGPPFVGTSRVGDPGERCSTASPVPGIIPPETPNILAAVDLRRLDAVCNPTEPALTLKRGECCGYVVTLTVWDTSICPSLSNDRHQIWHHFPVCICNDLPEV